MRTVSAAEANRHFSKLLRAVQAGERVVITSRGRPVAEMAPANDDVEKDDIATIEARERAERIRQRKLFLAELRKRPVMNLPRFSRDELYD